ncbi:MAG: hypothetical protein HZC12_04925 [Nitrospirae bacterium]|nr:hypothetical protein [Nitrospirota bacterium]
MKFDIPFSVIILSKKEFDFNASISSPFIESINEEGVIIYDAQQRRQEGTLKIQT